MRPFPGLARSTTSWWELYTAAAAAPAAATERAAARSWPWWGSRRKAHVPAARLSLIERRRLELARALATGPDLLLLDEFMAGLNPAETRTRWR